jgi:dCTP deaminase
MEKRYGAIPFQIIREMMETGYISGAKQEHIQPASLDPTLSEEVYRLRGSYLPRKGETIDELVKKGALYRHRLDLPLEVDGIYLIRLNESVKLPPGIHATASNKSSSGRINLRGRLLADGITRFDVVPPGYQGSLWIELVPKSFPVRVHPGDRINQLRFFHGDSRLGALEHHMLFDRFLLLREPKQDALDSNKHVINRGVVMTLDLATHDIVGWRGKRTDSVLLDTAHFEHDHLDFFEPVTKPKDGEITVRPGDFYILSTKEKVMVPPQYAAEMAPYDETIGEFRSHFAGFFDPGFGWHADEDRRGTIAVLEVEAHSHDFVMRDGQPICLMAYERMLQTPERLYGHDLKSNYFEQVGPRLAKWFKQTRD